VTTIVASVISARVIKLLKKTLGRIAKAVFFIVSLDCSKEDVNVSFEKRKRSPVEIIIPINKTMQNFKMNLNWKSF
jgi:hypothetical protein